MNKKVAIVGAGIAGLATAHHLNKNPDVNVTVFDRSHKIGGVLQTEHDDEFLIEKSADMFVSDPDSAIQLCEELGLEAQLITPNPKNRFSSIVSNGKLIRTPAGFSLLIPNQIKSVLQSPILSINGKVRFLFEWFCRTPSAELPDESLKSFATRHYGNEFFEKIVQPIVAGIYSADAANLSMQATLNRFVEMEKRHGSLIRAARIENAKKIEEQESSGARYGMFVSLKDGCQSLIHSIASVNQDVNWQLNTSVNAVRKHPDGWECITDNEPLIFDAVALATSAQTSSKILGGVDKDLCQILGSVPLGSMVVVAVTCRNENFSAGPPAGFGFVVPEIERMKLIACSFSSNKFSGRAPEGSHLMRAFINTSHIVDLDIQDDELIEWVVRDLESLIGFKTTPDNSFQVFRWIRCMPQYHVGHLNRLDQIREKLDSYPGLEVAGSSYAGVGIPACVDSGKQAAEKLISIIG